MLAGPKHAVSGPNEPPRSDRAIADSWRAYTGATRFRQCYGTAQLRSFETAQLARIYRYLRVFPCEDGWLAFRSVAAGLDGVIAEPG
jgi:hypothetical protein